MMPLALLGVGESGTITDIRGKEDVIHHLHNPVSYTHLTLPTTHQV